jgi:hypothetical protein
MFATISLGLIYHSMVWSRPPSQDTVPLSVHYFRIIRASVSLLPSRVEAEPQKTASCFIFIYVLFFKTVFYSGRYASFLRLLFLQYITQSWFLPPLRRLRGKPASNPGLLHERLVSASGLNHWATTSPIWATTCPHWATTSLDWATTSKN